MKKVNVSELRFKIDLLERLLSKEELSRSSIRGKLNRIRKQLNLLVVSQQ
tara:strand:- start:3804 stop:3953 length:150 start_codon:yes stop_codon:yes gene_type:complete